MNSDKDFTLKKDNQGIFTINQYAKNFELKLESKEKFLKILVQEIGQSPPLEYESQFTLGNLIDIDLSFKAFDSTKEILKHYLLPIIENSQFEFKVKVDEIDIELPNVYYFKKEKIVLTLPLKNQEQKTQSSTISQSTESIETNDIYPYIVSMKGIIENVSRENKNYKLEVENLKIRCKELLERNQSLENSLKYLQDPTHAVTPGSNNNLPPMFNGENNCADDKIEPKSENYFLFKFNRGQNWSLSRNALIATNYVGVCANILGDRNLTPDKINEWKIRIRHYNPYSKKGFGIFIGIVRSNAKILTDCINLKAGWVFGCKTRLRYNNEGGSPFLENIINIIKPGDVIGVAVDLIKGTISYNVNGSSYFIAYNDLPKNKTFIPFVILTDTNESVELLD